MTWTDLWDDVVYITTPFPIVKTLWVFMQFERMRNTRISWLQLTTLSSVNKAKQDLPVTQKSNCERRLQLQTCERSHRARETSQENQQLHIQRWHEQNWARLECETPVHMYRLLCFRGCKSLSKKPIDAMKISELSRYTNSYRCIYY